MVPSLQRCLPRSPGTGGAVRQRELRRYLFDGLGQALGRASQARPLLVILEDLHWADESTLNLFLHLAARLSPLPWMMIGTYRHGYAEDNPSLVRTLEELIRMRVRPLNLRSLSRPEVAQMLQGLSRNRASDRLASLIFEDTEGNPFFVEEVYKHLAEDGRIFDAAGNVRTDSRPGKRRAGERAARHRAPPKASTSASAALAAAAVIGRSFSFQLLSAISEMDVDELSPSSRSSAWAPSS
jgi:predicted ATPase